MFNSEHARPLARVTGRLRNKTLPPTTFSTTVRAGTPAAMNSLPSVKAPVTTVTATRRELTTAPLTVPVPVGVPKPFVFSHHTGSAHLPGRKWLRNLFWYDPIILT